MGNEKLLNTIQNLVRENPGQLSVEEYLEVASVVLKRKPCNFLIFGLGKDSMLWHNLNHEGITVFIEDNQDWFRQIKNCNPQIKAIFTQYNTKSKNAHLLLDKPEQLYMPFPSSVTETNWDIIFVDGPNGQHDDAPGRRKSIYMASKLISKNNKTYVMVHDCNREVERHYCDRFLLHKNLIHSKEKLRVYLIDNRV